MEKTPKQVILDVLHTADEALTASQIANMCGRKKTTPFMRHLRELVSAELVKEIKPDTSGNGRPAHLYRVKPVVAKGNPEHDWRQWCQRNFHLDYVVWLEAVYTGEIELEGGE